MPLPRLRLAALAALLTMSPSAAPAQALQGQTATSSLRQQFEQISRRRIVFGHQSVGENLLQGLADLSSEAGVPLRVVESEAPEALEQPGLVHRKIGKNEQPETKIAHFTTLLEGGLGQRAEIALYKLCYVDFGPDRDAARLFAGYRAAHQALRARFPATTFVHVTVPLTVVQRGLTGWVKNTFGGGAWGERENVLRHQFNQLLRAEYEGKEPIFDLARAESTGEDGAESTFERGGARYPALVPAYSDDGQHLNAAGRRRAALALISTLAGIPATTPR
ncbi:MAG TPA: hypothetical protein VIG99_24730 [Myxococcaceae bacterium]|jgi:hypothetical protein